MNSRCFPAAILVHQNGTLVSPYWKLYKGAWNVLTNNSETVCHKDLRIGRIVYILVFYNISFSWLLPLDGFRQFISFVAWQWKRSIWKPNNAFSRSTWDCILRNPRKNCFVSTLKLKKILPFTFVPLRLKELPTFHNFPKLQCYCYNRKSLFHRNLYCPNALWVWLRPCYPCRKFERLNHLLKDEVFLIGANIMNKASRYKM